MRGLARRRRIADRKECEVNRPISVGVLGLGSIAQIQHLPNLARMESRFRVAAVADISPRLTQRIADRLAGEVFASTDWREVCAHPEVEAVLVLTSGAHEQISQGALEAGKHVFAEKPLCLTAEGAERLHALATEKGLVLQVGYMKLHEELLPDLEEGLNTIGDLRLIRHSVYHPEHSTCLGPSDTLRFDDIDPQAPAEAAAFEERRTRQALGDLPPQWGWLYREVLAASFIHTVSFIRGVMGGIPRLTGADLWPPLPTGSPTEPPSFMARAEFPGHPRVEMSWLWLPATLAYREVFEAHGTRGSLEFRFPNPYFGRTATLVVKSADAAVCHPPGIESAFTRELKVFHRAITAGLSSSDAAGAAQDTAFLQDMVATLTRREGLAVGGEAETRR
ncbi:MAG: Gfo/Idh/MocA family oxidoreductase [Acidimicrobiia bacterium]|nr:Gfo/Idh/MocA family oxidoreductase [Acidimicrobiia bacterium]